MRQPLLLKLEETSKLLGIGRDLTYELFKLGLLPSIRLGKRRYVPRDALKKMLVTASAAKENQINE